LGSVPESSAYLKNHLDNLSDAEAGQILRGLHTACIQHDGQTRRSGGPYLIHPIAVAQLARDFGLSVSAQVAALLHDTVEDCRMTHSKVRLSFGNDIADMVEGLTKHVGEDNETYLQRIPVTASNHWETAVIKTLDRLHNLTTPYGGNTERERRLLNETLNSFRSMCEQNRQHIPQIHLADYDDLVTQVISLASKRLKEVESRDSVALSSTHLIRQSCADLFISPVNSYFNILFSELFR